MRRNLMYLVLFFAVLGIVDASYLTYEHYSQAIPPCSNSIFVDCGRVLQSKYAVLFGIPLSLLGLVHYSMFTTLVSMRLVVEKKMTLKDVLWKLVERYARPRELTLEKILFYAQLVESTIAFFFSLYLVYIQLQIIHAICLYCMLSAVISTSIFSITLIEFFRFQHRQLVLS